MNGHTGFLVSARCMPLGVDVARLQVKERQRYRGGKLMESEIAAEAERRAEDQSGDTRKYPRLPLPG